MKTSTVLIVAGGVGLVGYLVWRSRAAAAAATPPTAAVDTVAPPVADTVIAPGLPTVSPGGVRRLMPAAVPPAQAFGPSDEFVIRPNPLRGYR